MFVARYLKLIASVIVAAVLMMAVVVPMVYNQSMETTTIENEGAGWARFAYNPSGDYSESFTTDGSNITIGTQTGTASDMIVYATDVFSIVHADNSFHLIAPGGSSADLGAAAGVASTSGVITVTDSSNNAAYSTDAATWAYVPDAAGDFGFFTDSGATINDYSVAAAGSFAGAYAYNEINNLDISTTSTYSVIDGEFNAGAWTVAAPNSNVIVGNKINDKFTLGAVVAPSTGTLIDGLYYTFSGTDATVSGISESLSTATSIVIPDTVTSGDTTYNVTAIASSGNAAYGVFANLTSLETVTFSSNMASIGGYAFAGCSNLNIDSLPENLTTINRGTFSGCTNLALTSLPASVTTIGTNAFQNCTNLALTSLPDGLTSIGNMSFSSCRNLALTSLPDGLTSIGYGGFQGCTNLALTSLPDGLTSIEDHTFYNCTNLALTSLPASITLLDTYALYGAGISKLIIYGSPTINSMALSANISEILNLGSTSISAGDYGLSADVEIRDTIPSLGYIAPVEISEQTVREGVLYDVLALLPVMILVGVMMGVVALFLANRRA